MKVFRKELFLRDNVNYIPMLVCETPWWEKCDGVEVYHDDGDLPNVYHANVNGYEYVFHEDWCEEMTNKEEIAKIIYSYMGYVYCNNCRNKGNEEVCQWCNRKAMEWEISEEFSEKVADAIIEVIADDK